MDDRIFDLTVPVTRGFLLTQTGMGVVFVVLGFIYLGEQHLTGHSPVGGGAAYLDLRWSRTKDEQAHYSV